MYINQIELRKQVRAKTTYQIIMQIVKGLRIGSPRVKERSTIHKLTFKCLHNIASDLFKSCFINYSHIYSTRHNDIHILIPKVRTESAQKGTFYTGAQAFNNLPPHQKEVDSDLS